jgi:hypothetical protein
LAASQNLLELMEAWLAFKPDLNHAYFKQHAITPLTFAAMWGNTKSKLMPSN